MFGVLSRNKMKQKSPNNVTRIKPELQHIMQKFQQDKKPSNLKVLTSSDDAKTFGSPVTVRNTLEVKFKLKNSDKDALNIRRTNAMGAMQWQ